ncbi:MAG: MoaD/ThiS family protein [Nanoarchaeota archaeon]|nr:MoaD/ThiS family protein [Nanoarchaeota archaeon]MCG2717881.1 MoaD/ThiS family protein [Nanoarchaeota archaeon]
MKVFIEKENKTREIKAKTVNDLLEKLKINPITVLTVVNDELVTEDKKLNDKDEVKVLAVISGG